METVGPAELGGQRLQVSQVPEGVSGDEGIHPTDDSVGRRDLRTRMEVASLVACLQMRQVKRSHTLLRAGKTTKFCTSEAREIYGSDGVGSVPSGYGRKKPRNQLHVAILLVKSSGRGKRKWIFNCSPRQPPK